MELRIPCPQCLAELKLRDQSFLGRMGKCPRCLHRFVLELKDEVVLELAGEANSPAPALGTAPRRVQDSPSINFEQPSPPLAFEQKTKAPAKLVRSRRRRGAQWITLVLVGGLALGFGWFIYSNLYQEKEQKNEHASDSEQDPDDSSQEIVASKRGADDEAAEKKPFEQIAGANRKGLKQSPIDLRYLPSGSRLLVHLHPAELYRVGQKGEGEFAACLGPFGIQLQAILKDLCFAPVEEVEKVTLGIIPGERGQPVQIAAHITLLQEVPKSELLQRLGGERIENSKAPYYVAEGRARLIINQREYAVCPEGLAMEMIESTSQAHQIYSGLEALVPWTDQNRLVTILFVPIDLTLHSASLGPSNTQSLLQAASDWFGRDGEVDAAAWSIAFDDQFHSQIHLRTSSGITTRALEKSVRNSLEKTPRDVLELVRQMNPTTSGFRKIIGRVPAMVKVFALSTRIKQADRLVVLETKLPERAGPNLALGTLLAWDESTRTEFRPIGSGSSSETLPEKVADRLKLKINLQLKKEPLFQALEQIGEEASIKVSIDLKALELVGYTRNMEQNFTFENLSAEASFQQIIKKYGEMVLVVDEKEKKVIITTKAVATDKKLTPYQFPAPGIGT